jgi:uncharacterized protein (DUF2062 family)
MWRLWGPSRQFKLLLIRLARLRTSPDEIAKGLALGVFIGMTPTFGVQMPIAFFFAMLFCDSKIAAVIGVWITNPITAPFIYALEYEAGRLLLGQPHPQVPLDFTWQMLMQLGWDFALPLLVGSLVFGVLTAAVTYALALRFVPMMHTLRIPRWPRRRSMRP